MPICKQCGKYFKSHITINGERKDIGGHRKRCLECFPLGSNNVLNNKKCIICGRDLVGNQTKFCSSECKFKQGYKNWLKLHPKIKKLPKTKEEKLNYYREYRAKVYAERDRVFGMKCKICGHEKNLDLHRKSGESHQASFEWIRVAIKHPNEWVRLCNKCHTGSHFCMDVFGWTWDDIEMHIINGGVGKN